MIEKDSFGEAEIMESFTAKRQGEGSEVHLSGFSIESKEGAREIASIAPERLGVSLSAKTKSGGKREVTDLLRIAKGTGATEVQVDLRKGSQEDSDAIERFTEENPNVRLTIHAASPTLNPETFETLNEELIKKQAEASLVANGALLTIHPPGIKRLDWETAADANRIKIKDNFAELIADVIINASLKGRTLQIAVENLPTKGDEGNWGQTPEEIKEILDLVGDKLAQRGLSQDEIDRCVGITLDVDHALSGGKPEEEIDKWLKTLGSRIKAAHIYCPSSPREDFKQKFLRSTQKLGPLASDFPVYIESKQSESATQEVYSVASELLK